MNCRHCGNPLTHTFIDLGFAPPSNAYLTEEDLSRPETWYPLRTKVCDNCWLVQTEDYADAAELFAPDYAYFSSTSSGWLEHARRYSDRVIDELALGGQSHVIEVASNDGYLLRNFVAAGIPCLGIEPTASTAAAAARQGIPVLREFFGEALGMRLARENKQADLIAGNNVYAHVPDINDFTRGLKATLKPGGVVTLEFPHLMRLIEQAQFDTVYHEHFSYLSLHTVSRLFAAAGLRVWKVEELPTHGGSLRVWGCHADGPFELDTSVDALLGEETRCGLQRLETYLAFQPRAERIKNDLLTFLIAQKRAGKTVAAYGAAAKGNTLLNFAGVRADLLPYVCDRAPSKQGKLMPGSHIPILAPSQLAADPPDFVMILPWNIAQEVRDENMALTDRGVQFFSAVPELRFL
mgnify:CR=1 FL=1